MHDFVQLGTPLEEDLASWGHHSSPASVPDAILQASAGNEVRFLGLFSDDSLHGLALPPLCIHRPTLPHQSFHRRFNLRDHVAFFGQRFEFCSVEKRAHFLNWSTYELQDDRKWLHIAHFDLSSARDLVSFFFFFLFLISLPRCWRDLQESGGLFNFFSIF